MGHAISLFLISFYVDNIQYINLEKNCINFPLTPFESKTMIV